MDLRVHLENDEFVLGDGVGDVAAGGSLVPPDDTQRAQYKMPHNGRTAGVLVLVDDVDVRDDIAGSLDLGDGLGDGGVGSLGLGHGRGKAEAQAGDVGVRHEASWWFGAV